MFNNQSFTVKENSFTVNPHRDKLFSNLGKLDSKSYAIYRMSSLKNKVK